MAKRAQTLGSANVELRADPSQFTADLRSAEQQTRGFVSRVTAAISSAVNSVSGFAGTALGTAGRQAAGVRGSNSPWMAHVDAPDGTPQAAPSTGMLAALARFGGAVGIATGTAYASFAFGRRIGQAAYSYYQFAAGNAGRFAYDAATADDVSASNRLRSAESLQREYEANSGFYSGIGMEGIGARFAQMAKEQSKNVVAARAQMRRQAVTEAANKLASEVIGLGTAELVTTGNVATQSTFFNAAGDAIRLRAMQEQRAIAQQSLSNLEQVRWNGRAGLFK